MGGMTFPLGMFAVSGEVPVPAARLTTTERPADSRPTAARSTMARTLHMPWSLEGIVDDQ